MKWLPPRSLAARREWAEAHPWLAGFFFGLFLSIWFAVYVAIRTGVGVGVLVAASMWLVLWPLFAVGIKRRWGQRPNAENHPTPTRRRPLSRASDRWLSWFMWAFAASAIVSVFELVIGPARASALFTLGISLLFGACSWIERRRRRMSH